MTNAGREMMEARPPKQENNESTETGNESMTSVSTATSDLVGKENQTEAKAEAQELGERILFTLLQMENCTRYVSRLLNINYWNQERMYIFIQKRFPKQS